jgi:hypothetical protein
MTREEAQTELAKLPAKEQRALMDQVTLLQLQQGHQKRWDLWHESLRVYLRAERGRASELARHLGVRRQSLWRWVNQPYSKFPAWAAVATLVWYFRQAPSEAVAISGAAVGPALQLVSPQADNLCPRIAGQ